MSSRRSSPSMKSPRLMQHRYEIPMGMSAKLMRLGDFELLDFTIDDSGSMYLIFSY
jgi:hypothetical protein